MGPDEMRELAKSELIEAIDELIAAQIAQDDWHIGYWTSYLEDRERFLVLSARWWK